MKFGYLSIALLGATAAVAQGQEAKGNIYDLLTAPNNTLGVSKFVGLVKSDSGYQPVVDLLQQPGNLTCFIPNDRVFSKILFAWKAYAKTHHINTTGNYPPANMSYNNLSIVDFLSYHVVGERVNLTSLTDNVNIVHSVLNKTGAAYLNGSGLSILIEDNATFSEFYNQTWLASNSKFLNFHVGNGNHDADVQYKDLNATNGLLNVIKSVLIPPMKPTIVIGEEGQTSALAKLLKDHPNLADTLNNATNFTLFAPSNNALNKVNFTELSNSTIESIILTHLVPGIYYSPNISMAASKNNGNVTLTSLNNVTLPAYVNSTSGAVTLNNTIHVTKPNVFFNSGVMHVIDGILMPTV